MREREHRRHGEPPICWSRLRGWDGMGVVGRRTACWVVRGGPRLLAHRREVASWAPRLWLAPSSRHRFGVIATRPQSVTWCGEEICVDTVLPPITDPSLGSARPESESCGSTALSMGRRGGESLLKRPETFGKGSVILSLTLSCLLSWRD